MKRIEILTALAFAGLTLNASAAPSVDGECATTKTATCTTEQGKDVVDTALAAGQFGTLARALTAAGLVDALRGEGPFTVFAPTDAAFALIPEKDLQALLQPENRGALASILTYHVVPGRVAAADVVKLTGATALNGQRIVIEATDAGVNVAGVKVVKTDIECSNGIIHVVDAVMMPATADIVDTAVQAGGFETLAAALQAGGLVEALKGDGPFTVFAPTDAAFAALPEGTLESLLKPENRDQLVKILKYHVVPGRVYADQLENGAVKTLQGEPVHVALKDEGAFIDKSRVTAADIETTNGVIHVIDRVLLPR
jgi:uncharacterized surface protein with fasciclin (FAS1) repeats